MRPRRHILLLLLPLALSCGRDAARVSPSLARGLEELDSYVAARPVYETRKRDQLDGIRHRIASTADPSRRLDLCLYAADEFFAYNFDSTQYYLKEAIGLASKIHDPDRFDEASIRLGHLYAKSGSYMEAYNRLFNQIDTGRLSAPLRIEYLMTLYDFSRDLAGNSGMVERPQIEDRDVYRQQLYRLIPKDSKYWRELRLDELSSAGRMSEADSLAREMIASVSPEEHTYAIYAYEMSVLAEQKGLYEERMNWLVKSAKCDLLNAIKDYASLAMISQLLPKSEVDRSFHYLRICQEDAIFYNAKLRPWQISQFFLGIEDAYSERLEREHRASVISTILLSALTLVLLLLAWFLIVRSRKLTRMQRALAEGNSQLAAANATLGELNRELSKADQVKEKYIVDFLRKFSANVTLWQTEDNRARNLLKQGKADQLLRELSLSTRSEKGLKEFYRTFDSTFLAICPDFVERFNELLREDARFSPKEGSLNTELRIFALIRLGVDDSREIADLLHYSQSTIYNYKVSVKNAALGERDRFEERVKQIGK